MRQAYSWYLRILGFTQTHPRSEHKVSLAVCIDLGTLASNSARGLNEEVRSDGHV